MIETHKRIEGIEKAAWNALVGEGSPFMEWGFLVALERSGCLDQESGWYPLILTLKNASGELLGAAPLFLKTHSQGEFVFDWSWADAAHRAGIPYYPKGVVASPFSPVTGVRLLVAPHLSAQERLKTRETLVNAAIELAKEIGLSSLHFNFVLEDEWEAMGEMGLLQRQGIQYHWKNHGYETFDDFLGELKSKRRANIRRERRILGENGVATRILGGDELTPELMDRMYKYYRNTVHKFYWGSQYLTRAFFKEILKQMPEHLHIVFAEEDGEIFGGAFNIRKGERLYGRYWGAERDVEFAHFEVCMYTSIEWCIQNGVQVFEPGAGGEHKHDRGFEATATHSAHWIADPRLSDAIGRFLEHERQGVERNIELLDAQGAFKKGPS